MTEYEKKMHDKEVEGLLRERENERKREKEDRDEYHRTVNALFSLVRENGEKLVKVETTTDAIQIAVTSLTKDVANLQCEGCAVGKRHDTDIKELKERPAKMLVATATIAGIVSSLVSFCIYLFGKDPKQ